MRQLFGKAELLEIDCYDLLPVLEAWEVALDGLVDAARSEQGHIYEIGPRSCSHHENAVASFNAIEIAEELVHNSVGDHGLSRASLGHERVELIEEQDRGFLVLSFLEEFADVLLTCADVLVEQLWPFDADEIDVEFLGDGSSDVGLAAAGWTVEK